MTTTYPAFVIDAKNSSQRPNEDLVVDQWPNGNSRGRSYFITGKYVWQLYHGVLADANRATLKAFYDTNRLLLFDYVSHWDAVTYHNVGFIAVPDYITRTEGTAFWDVKVQLRQFN